MWIRMHVSPDAMDKVAGRRLVGRFLATLLPSRRAPIMERMAGVANAGCGAEDRRCNEPTQRSSALSQPSRPGADSPGPIGRVHVTTSVHNAIIDILSHL